MSRHKKPDIAKAGRSRLVPYYQGEGRDSRHARRLEFAVNNREQLIQFCADHGWEVVISNYGHHWRITKNKTVVEWWPSSAKLIINKKWDRGIHTHDYQQVIKVLERLEK